MSLLKDSIKQSRGWKPSSVCKRALPFQAFDCGPSKLNHFHHFLFWPAASHRGTQFPLPTLSLFRLFPQFVNLFCSLFGHKSWNPWTTERHPQSPESNTFSLFLLTLLQLFLLSKQKGIWCESHRQCNDIPHYYDCHRSLDHHHNCVVIQPCPELSSAAYTVSSELTSALLHYSWPSQQQ